MELDIIETNLQPSGFIKENIINTYIVIDHSGKEFSDIYSLDEQDRLKGHPMFTHHYLIRKNGSIFRGRNEKYESGIDVRFNLNTIGIMLEGDFNKERPSSIQFNTLIHLIKHIKKKNNYIKDNVYTHSELSSWTTSPGRLFPYVTFKNKLRDNNHILTTSCNNIKDETVFSFGSRNLELKVPNMKGNDIYELKLILSEAGYVINNMDDIFDKELENLIKTIQKQYGIYDDGLVNEIMFKIINNIKHKELINRDEHYIRYLYLKKPNMTGIDIKIIKSKLFSLNYFKGTVNNVFDEDMEEAVRKYQKDKNIEVNGCIGPLTFYSILRCKEYVYTRVLELADPIMEGADVEIIQQSLFDKGYNCNVTGFYDITTHTAVVQYQLDNNYLVDGKVDEDLFYQILN